MNERVQAAKLEIRDNIDKMDRGVEQVGDTATRMKLARDIAGLKAETASLLGNARDLAPFTEPGESGRYRGIDAGNPREFAVKTVADDQVRRVAERYGVDPQATIERYAAFTPSKGLERQFERAEVEERGRSRFARGEGQENDEGRQDALSQMHHEITEIYDAARLRMSEATRQERDSPEPAGARHLPPEAEAARHQPGTDALHGKLLEGQAATRRDETRREEAKRQQDREDAERSRRERDDGRGL